MEFSKRYEIVVPSTMGEATPADVEFAAQCLADIVSRFNSYFGGSTVIDAAGAWDNDNGQTISEVVKIVYAYGDNSTESWLFVVDTAAWLRDTMKQTCVLVARLDCNATLV